MSLEQNLKIRNSPKQKIVIKKEMFEYLWDLYDIGTLNIADFLECARHITQALYNKNPWTSIDEITNSIMPIV